MTLRHPPLRPDVRLRRAIDRLSEPTWLSDRRGDWIWVSAAWTRLTGQPQRAALGEGWLACVDAACARDWRAALAGLGPGDACTQEMHVMLPEGSRVRCVFEARAPVDADDGADDGADGSAIVGRCLAPPNRAAGQTSPAAVEGASRDHVLALVSHELRSPLNGIQSWAHVLENHLPAGSEIVRRALAGIRTGVSQQVRLIDGLIDATQVIGGRPMLASRRVPLDEPARRALAQVETSARERRQTLDCVMPVPVPAALGDADRIEQVLAHLLSNAVKFAGSQARIVVRAVERPEAGEVCVTVSDDGPGLPAGLVDAMFEPFNQARHVSARASGGLGLGLALARRLAELMGGGLDASNEPGHGARFVLRLPMAEQATRGAPALAQPSLHGMRLMLVDDQHEARESLAELLRHAGARVEALASGSEAVGVFGRLARDERPDVLICDIAMPGLDGYATLQRIRAIERAGRVSAPPASGEASGALDGEAGETTQVPSPAEGVPAVALTAFAQRADRVRALLGGFHVHLPKPVDPADLIAILAALGPREAAQSRPH